MSEIIGPRRDLIDRNNAAAQAAQRRCRCKGCEGPPSCLCCNDYLARPAEDFYDADNDVISPTPLPVAFTMRTVSEKHYAELIAAEAERDVARRLAEARGIENAEMRSRAVRTHTAEGFVNGGPRRGTVCSLCSWARIYWDDDPLEHSPDCPLASDPDQRGAAVLAAAEAGRVLLPSLWRLMGLMNGGNHDAQMDAYCDAAEPFQQFREAISAWDRALGGAGGGGGGGDR